MRHRQQARLAALTIGTALAFWACDDQSHPIAPATPRPTLRAEDYGALTFSKPRDLPALARVAALNRDVVVSRTISPSGGTIVLREAGIALRFPPGALASRTRITVTAHAGEHVTYSFEPHGLQFAVPVDVAQFFIFASGHDANDVVRDLQGAYLAHGVDDLDASGVATVAEVYPVQVRTFEPFNERFVPALATFRIGHFSGYMLASAGYMLGSSGYMLASGRTDSTTNTTKPPR
jgi:hypothetical protein